MTEEDNEESLANFRKEWEAYRTERNERLHRFFFRVMVIFAILGITVSAEAYFTWDTAKQSRDGLCAIRQDAERRVVLGKEFLKDNPQGISGISPAVLKRSIDTSQETIDSLSDLDCTHAKVPTPTATPTPTPTETP